MILGPWLFVVGGVALAVAFLLRMRPQRQTRPHNANDVDQDHPLIREQRRQAAEWKPCCSDPSWVHLQVGDGQTGGGWRCMNCGKPSRPPPPKFYGQKD